MRRSRRLLFGTETRRLELLLTPICDLPLKLKGSLVEEAIGRVRRDLRKYKIRIRPHFYLSDDYGCCHGTANIGAGFWDADADLRQLRYEATGSLLSKQDLVRILRHEIGHAFCYLNRLYFRREFRKLFDVKGSFFKTYPVHDRFRPNPWSHDYVNPFGDHYAQKHPDDDFAETFSVWMEGPEWKKKYRKRRGALQKLQYVDGVVREFAGKKPFVENDPTLRHAPAEEIRMTVAEFFQLPLREYRRKATGFLDPDLISIFSRRVPRRNSQIGVREFIRENKRTLIRRVSRWVKKVPEGVMQDLLDKAARRGEALDLAVRRKTKQTVLVDLAAYLTTLAANYMRIGEFFPEK